MFAKISQNLNLKKDIKFFQTVISNTHNQKTKKVLEDLLKELKKNIEIVDLIHNENNSLIDPLSCRENVETIFQLRKEINKIIKDLQST